MTSVGGAPPLSSADGRCATDGAAPPAARREGTSPHPPPRYNTDRTGTESEAELLRKVSISSCVYSIVHRQMCLLG